MGQAEWSSQALETSKHLRQSGSGSGSEKSNPYLITIPEGQDIVDISSVCHTIRSPQSTEGNTGPVSSVVECWCRGTETGNEAQTLQGFPTWSRSIWAGCSCGFRKELGQETLETVSYKRGRQITKYVLLIKALI